MTTSVSVDRSHAKTCSVSHATPDRFSPSNPLQAEGACFLIAACAAYNVFFPHHWVLFACLFLVPDVSLLPYVKGPSAAASVFYTLTHTYVLPVLLGVVAAPLHSIKVIQLSLIWIAHISMDRMIAAGLKYPTAFRFTHIQSTLNQVKAPGIGVQHN